MSGIIVHVAIAAVMQVGQPAPQEMPGIPVIPEAYQQQPFGGQAETRHPFDTQQNWVHGYFQEIPAYRGHVYFRPYNYKHVLSQSQTAGGWGMNPNLAYSQQFWHRYQDQATMLKMSQNDMRPAQPLPPGQYAPAQYTQGQYAPMPSGPIQYAPPPHTPGQYTPGQYVPVQYSPQQHGPIQPNAVQYAPHPQGAMHPSQAPYQAPPGTPMGFEPGPVTYYELQEQFSSPVIPANNMVPASGIPQGPMLPLPPSGR
jgi:hypothetical protein